MKAYYYDETVGDQRESHDSGYAVGLESLAKLGILYDCCPSISSVNVVAARRCYRNKDEIIISPEKMGPEYEDKVKLFFNEHLHEDEEIRYILDGGGFFDVRDTEDKWIRIKVEKNDLIVLPAGIYHRFTTDSSNYIRAMRLFQDEPKWTPLLRGPIVEMNDHRQKYLQTQDRKAITT